MFINKISLNSPKNNYQKNKTQKDPNFKGVGEFGAAALNGVSNFFKLCDDVPMVGVSFMDGASAIAPRTVVDLNQAGIPAAAETFRRESSGLVVNCLIPGAFVYGAAKCINNGWMRDYLTEYKTPVDLAGSWANGESVENLVGIWKQYANIGVDFKNITDTLDKENFLKSMADKKFKGKGFIKDALNKIEGLNGTNNWEKLSDHKELINKASELLEDYVDNAKPRGLIDKFKYNRSKNKAIQNAYNVLVKGQYNRIDNFGTKIPQIIEENGGLRAAQNLKFNGKEITSDLKSFLRDTVDVGSALSSCKEARLNPNDFTKRAKGLINSKSIMGLAVVVPLAMSMQYINRAITRHKYNRSGAPIYKDFENESRTLTEKEKRKLRLMKPLSVASIVGLAALSMGKSFPKSFKQFGEMLQFNTKFPTINQCRLIATATFASRMLASEDPNELRESTVRDLATFSGLYFLGDYAEKLTAEGIQKFSKAGRTGELQMFNRTKDPSEYKNIFEKAAGWVKDKKIKSFDEIPDQFKGHRSLAKLGGLGFSIALLGVLLPMYNKHVTNKKEAKRKEILEKQKECSNTYNPKTIFPSKEPTEEEIRLSVIEESKKKFKAVENYSTNPAFSKVASNLIK